MEIYYFNTKDFLINSIIALCSRNHSPVLAYIYIHTYIHTQVAVDGRVMMTHAHVHTHVHTHAHPDPMCAQTHASGARLLQLFQECFHYTNAHILYCLHKHISLRLQERFRRSHAALHATCVLISPVCDESSWWTRCYCRLYCETTGHGAPVL